MFGGESIVTTGTSLPIVSRPSEPRRRLPHWLKRPLPPGDAMMRTRRLIDELELNTVCSEARCPNLTECWTRGTATFMILGHRCTRRCGFCAVETSKPLPPEPDEPQRLAAAAARLALRHVVITSVARDDLPDEGAGHFARCIEAIRDRLPEATIEVLVPDFHGRPELIEIVTAARPEVYNHNIETVARLQKRVRPAARYERSLDVMRIVKRLTPTMVTKSGIMLGLGETRDEIVQTFRDLLAAAVHRNPTRRSGLERKTDGPAHSPKGQGFAARRVTHFPAASTLSPVRSVGQFAVVLRYLEDIVRQPPGPAQEQMTLEGIGCARRVGLRLGRVPGRIQQAPLPNLVQECAAEKHDDAEYDRCRQNDEPAARPLFPFGPHTVNNGGHHFGQAHAVGNDKAQRHAARHPGQRVISYRALVGRKAILNVCRFRHRLTLALGLEAPRRCPPRWTRQ